MAQLKDTIIDGTLDVSSHITLPNAKNIYGIHPTTGEPSSLISISSNGNVVVGYTGYDQNNGNTHLYGKDVVNYVYDAGSFRAYRKAGDSIDFSFRGAGYVTNSGQDVTFLVPFAVPIVGTPTVTVTSINGFTLRQGTKYTHGSSASVSVKPDSYSAALQWCVGIYVTAKFSNTTNVTNNDAVGIYWSGNITFS